MYYYAYLDANDICTQIYAMPAAISGSQFVAIPSNDQSLVGKHFNRNTSEFETVYYYAVLNESNIVESVMYNTTQQTTSATLIAITFEQYQTVTGMYWNGTEFTEPPISALAVASTDEINYKSEEKWLSTKLDEIEADIESNADDISIIATDLATVVSSLTTVSNSLTTLNTAVEGKANASHTHTATDISGVVKTVNGTAPDENGNITVAVSGGGMTATEILEAVKTVDGTGSGLDADTIDGLDATAFATANHTHSDYLTADSLTGYVTTGAMNTALTGKADSTHNHDTVYSAINHTHDGYATTASVTALETAVEDVETLLDDKADIDHTHSEYATIAALNEKSDVSHTHSDYITATTYANGMSNKADASHTHSGYLSTSGGTVSGNLNVAGIVRVNGQQALYDSGSMVTLSTNNRQTMIAGSAIFSKTTISVSSDERLKENIKPAETDELVELVKNIDVKTFDYIDGEKDCIGVIAQEVVKKNPNLAKYLVRQDENGYYSVKTADLVFPLIAAVQSLNTRIDNLKQVVIDAKLSK